MEFKKWIVQEMGHMGVEEHGVDTIDLRIEMWPPEMEAKFPAANILHDFYGAIPSNSASRHYIVYSKSEGRAHVTNTPPQGLYKVLPDGWWDYARILYTNGKIKWETLGMGKDNPNYVGNDKMRV